MNVRPINLRDWQVRAFRDGRLSLLLVPVRPIWAVSVEKGEYGEYTAWKTPWASVWSNGVWHTWDGHRVGGENSVEKTPEIAKEQATLSAISQGFYRCPLGQPGDRLWGREAHYIQGAHGQHRDDGLRWGSWGGLPTTVSPDGTKIAYYREGFDRCAPRWRSSTAMPRWASRILLEVTSVRVMRVQEVTEAEATACGFCVMIGTGYNISCPPPIKSARSQLEDAWDAQAKPGPCWVDNPWAWAVGVKRVEAAA